MTKIFHFPISLLILFAFGCQRPSQEMESVPASAAVVPDVKTTFESAIQPVVREQILFTDQPDGVSFNYRSGEDAGIFAMPESFGGGVGLWDFDQDGLLDIVFPGGGSFAADAQPLGRAGALYRQSAELHFSAVTKQAGLDSTTHYTHGAAIADADNDGFPDLIVTGYEGLLYFHNCGDGTFTESAAIAALNDRLWSCSAAWCDLNEDGVLDLFVVHYVDWSPAKNPMCKNPSEERRDVCPPRIFDPLPDLLYFGNGDGTFRDGSREAGLSSIGKGLGVVIADVDLDGHQDVYVANDSVPNFLYHNDGHGVLEDVSISSGTSVNDRGLPDGSMGVDIGDFNLDGLPDVWVSNYERENFAVYLNFGRGFFRHMSHAMGVTAVGGQFVGWGTISFDVDCDGDEDVFVSNGHAIHFPDYPPVRQLPLLFENLAGKRFENVSPRAGNWMSLPHSGRGAAVGDLDRDGDLDLVVSSVNEPVALLWNETRAVNNWLQIRLIGITSSRDAQGARITVQTELATQSRQVKGGGSYASSSDQWLHFGLSRAEHILEVTVHWPSGAIQTLRDVAMNDRHTIIESAIDRKPMP